VGFLLFSNIVNPNWGYIPSLGSVI